MADINIDFFYFLESYFFVKIDSRILAINIL